MSRNTVVVGAPLAWFKSNLLVAASIWNAVRVVVSVKRVVTLVLNLTGAIMKKKEIRNESKPLMTCKPYTLCQPDNKITLWCDSKDDSVDSATKSQTRRKSSANDACSVSKWVRKTGY